MPIEILKATMSKVANLLAVAAILFNIVPVSESGAQTAAAPDTQATELPPMVRLVQEAEFLAGRGQLKLAIDRYEEALTLGAGSAEVLNRLGTLYLADGKVAESIAAFKLSMAERPGQLQVYSALGEAFLAAGQLDSAIVVIEAARRLSPQVSVIQSSLGFLYMQAGNRTRAKTHLDSALLLDERNPEAHRYLGFHYTRVDSLERAIPHYETVTELLPGDVEAYNNLGFLHSQLGRYSQALSYYKRAKELSPDPDFLHAINLNMEALRAIMAGKLRARMILVDSEEQGRDLLRRIEAGEDFSQLAARFSKAPNARDGGDLGFFGPGDMLEAVEEAVLKLQVNEVSGMIRIPQGVMLLQRLN